MRRGLRESPGGVSGVPQVGADLYMLAVLRLWPLVKVLAHIEASHCPPKAYRFPRFVQEILRLWLELVACL